MKLTIKMYYNEVDHGGILVRFGDDTLRLIDTAASCVVPDDCRCFADNTLHLLDSADFIPEDDFNDEWDSIGGDNSDTWNNVEFSRITSISARDYIAAALITEYGCDETIKLLGYTRDEIEELNYPDRWMSIAIND